MSKQQIATNTQSKFNVQVRGKPSRRQCSLNHQTFTHTQTHTQAQQKQQSAKHTQHVEIKVAVARQPHAKLFVAYIFKLNCIAWLKKVWLAGWLMCVLCWCGF